MMKRSQFVQLTLLMLLLFTIFQITSISISFNDIKDSFAPNHKTIETFKGKHDNNLNYNSDTMDSTKTILMITGENIRPAAHIEEELIYLKKEYLVSESLLTLKEEELADTELIILASDKIEGAYNLKTIQDCMKKGIHIIMAVMPSVDEIDHEWKTLLGIKTIESSYNQVGITTFSGFFLGGKQDYEELVINMNNIEVTSTCKTFVAGIKKVDTASETQLPDILWRNMYEGSQIFVVNGSFFENDYGTGILCAIFSQLYQDFIYPIINAKALFVNNAPYLTLENDHEMQIRYARNSQRFLEDIALPGIIAVCMSTGNVPTFYVTDSLDENNTTNAKLNESVISAVKDELNRIGGEIGISTYTGKVNRTNNQITNIENIYKKTLGDYNFQSLYFNDNDQNYKDSILGNLGELSTIHSLVSPWEEGNAVSYFNHDIVNIPVMTEGYTYSDEELFKLQSIATSMGFLTHEIDMSDIVYPEGDKDDWSIAFANFTAAIDTYWANYKNLDSLNITGVNERITRFLNMKPHISIQDNRIMINIEEFESEAYFMLRTNKKIAKIYNGTFATIEDGTYLIHASNAKIEITLQ